MILKIVIAAVFVSFPITTYAQENPFSFLVQSQINGQPQGFYDPEIMRRHDWGGPGVPLGYQASENVMLPTGAAMQSWSYGSQPIQFVQANGDGGQIMSVSGSKAYFWATQDGSYNGLQYFVGPSCGGEGWFLFDTANQINSAWTSVVAHLAISKQSSTDCPPLGASFTRWMRGLVVYPFQVAGKATGSVVLDTLLTEHYDSPTGDESVNMERNWFVKGMGNLRWEAWGKTRDPGDNLSYRCPPINLGGYYTPEFSGFHLVDCRYWTNFEIAPQGFTTAQYGWPFVSN